MQEIQPWVPSRGQEDPLEEDMATTPVFLPGESLWRIPWTQEPGGLQAKASRKSQTQMSRHGNAHLMRALCLFNVAIFHCALHTINTIWDCFVRALCYKISAIPLLKSKQDNFFKLGS